MTHAGDRALLLALGVVVARFAGVIPRGDGRSLASRSSRFAGLRRAIPARASTPAALVDERRAFLSVFPGVMVAMLLAAPGQTILAAAIPRKRI